MNAIIYARYSSHNQREESIEGQLRECHRFADQNGYTVIAEYCDKAISGTTDQRPRFQDMIRDSAKKNFSAILMYSVDRFARSRYDAAYYKHILKKNGVRCIYVTTPMPDSPEAILLESIMEGYAEYYSAELSRKIKRGMTDNAIKGFANNQAPLGYKIIDKHFVIDEKEAAIVRTIFQMYADGYHTKDIVDYCNDHGYRTKKGKRFGYNSFHSILNNEKYIGILRYEDIIRDDIIEPIISRELWDKAHLVYQSSVKARGGHYTAKEEYLLTGKLFCGMCGSSMKGESGVSSTGKTYSYYTCRKRKDEHACDKRPVPKKKLEELITSTLLERVLTPENIDLMADKVIEILDREANNADLIASLETELDETKKRIETIMDALEILSDKSKMKPMIERLETLSEKEYDLELRLIDEKKKKPSLTKDQVVYWLLSCREGDIQDSAFQKRLINMLVAKVFVYDSPNGGHRIQLFFNTTANNQAEITTDEAFVRDTSLTTTVFEVELFQAESLNFIGVVWLDL